MKTRSAVLVLLASILILLVVTNFFLKQRYEHELQLMREEVRTIARNTADNFTAEELEALQKWTDVDTQAYKSIINRLIEIKKKNPDLMYAYILRKTDSPYFYSFVADAESIDIHSRLDLNDDGLVNDMVAPGYIFLDVYPNKSAIYNAFYLGRASADPEPTYDLWGSWIAGHAPIYDRAGNIKAVIGVDVDASKLPHNNEILSYITILYAFIILIYLGNKALKQRYS